ncbi:hypothetical protein SAMN05444141_102645 [Pseudovibrio denitrificans]|uniref:Uncharacterized protein n=1 Tax=Pseudovibrio denitrificans TaxID=258256 RepID=A0A1I6ZVS7_9HYPH|nr:hypothetical protein SAMN05444141_102645 [Pseudovibrio denitrificans]
MSTLTATAIAAALLAAALCLVILKVEANQPKPLDFHDD